MNAGDMQRDNVWVRRIDDDRDVPLAGLVIGWEEEDRVTVLWGDAAYTYRHFVDPVPAEARTEWMDELAPMGSAALFGA